MLLSKQKGNPHCLLLLSVGSRPRSTHSLCRLRLLQMRAAQPATLRAKPQTATTALLAHLMRGRAPPPCMPPSAACGWWTRWAWATSLQQQRQQQACQQQRQQQLRCLQQRQLRQLLLRCFQQLYRLRAPLLPLLLLSLRHQQLQSLPVAMLPAITMTRMRRKT